MLSVKNTGLGVRGHGPANSVTSVSLRLLFFSNANENDQPLLSLAHWVGGCEHHIRGERKRGNMSATHHMPGSGLGAWHGLFFLVKDNL